MNWIFRNKRKLYKIFITKTLLKRKLKTFKTNLRKETILTLIKLNLKEMGQQLLTPPKLKLVSFQILLLSWIFVLPSGSKETFPSTNFYLISRKDWRRSGRRFIVRGLDHEGNAANFAETEHVFVQYLNGIRNMKVASYL